MMGDIPPFEGIDDEPLTPGPIFPKIVPGSASTSSYANHPPTIGEIRSDKSNRAQDWSARDLLISILRRIDAGEIDATDMAVIWTEKGKDGNEGHCGEIMTCGAGTHTIVGTIQVGLWRFIRNNSR